MRTLKAGALFFALVFWVGAGPYPRTVRFSHVGRIAGVLLEAPLMLVTTIIASR
jgi:hypothetical protein